MARRRSPRVRFQDNYDDTFTGLLSLPSAKSTCQTLKLYVVVSCPSFKAILLLYSLNKWFLVTHLVKRRFPGLNTGTCD